MKNKISIKVKRSVWNEKYSNMSIGYCAVCWKEVGKPVSLGGKTEFASAEFGHIVSEKNGGKITIDNLEILCKSCNVMMGTETLTDFTRTKPINMNYTEDNLCYMDIDGDDCYEYLRNGRRCRNKPSHGFLCHIHRAPHKTLDKYNI